jgi:hypothetical protein
VSGSRALRAVFVAAEVLVDIGVVEIRRITLGHVWLRDRRCIAAVIHSAVLDVPFLSP